MFDRKAYMKIYNQKEEAKKSKKQQYRDNPEYYKQYNKRWHLNHKEIENEKSKQRRKEHPEYMEEYNKQYYKDNLEHIKQYCIDNKEHRKENSKQYCLDHPEYEKQRHKQYRKDHPEYKKQYYKTPTGKLSCQKSEAKRRELGFIPLNEPFVGSVAHHISQNFVIYMPKELHQNLYHNIWTWENMEQMNKLAIEFL